MIQLLCTFVREDEIQTLISDIQDKYDVVGNKIFVLENKDDPSQFILTYNVKDMSNNDILRSTISVHRKKHTNTIYTINSLNEIIKSKNNGILDKRYKVNWEDHKDSIVVIAYNKLKIIHTSLKEVIHLGGIK